MAHDAASAYLQPSLLDRLIDTVPTLTVFEIDADPRAIERAGVGPAQLAAALVGLGLKRWAGEGSASPPQHGWMRWLYSAPGRTLGPAEVRTLRIPSREGSSALETLCEVRARIVANTESRPAERRVISMRRLRECVLRDLGWLLNAVNLESSADLERFPNVARSVLNFGMPSLAGRLHGSIEPAAVADRIRLCIETYEPRLSAVTVTPAAATADGSFVLEFRIEADLWGDPVPQHLSMRTRIDLSTGDILLDDGVA